MVAKWPRSWPRQDGPLVNLFEFISKSKFYLFNRAAKKLAMRHERSYLCAWQVTKLKEFLYRKDMWLIPLYRVKFMWGGLAISCSFEGDVAGADSKI